jgi:RNA polymerase sigma-70 factor (ECF subfamily)
MGSPSGGVEFVKPGRAHNAGRADTDRQGTRGGTPVTASSERNGAVRTNDELGQMLLDGDPETAYTLAHRRYSSRLEGVATRILGNRADAQDVVQKIFISLRKAKYQGRSSLWTYLYRAAVNGSVNVLRSHRRREAAERNMLEQQLLHGPVSSGSPESKVLEGEILACVAQALMHVKPQHRRVLVLRIIHGMTNTEIAEMEGLPAATVGTWLRRGRDELQRNLKPVLREFGRDTGGNTS